MPVKEFKRSRNPLHQYQSYDYRHILIIANTTDVIEELEKDSTYYDITRGAIGREKVERASGDFFVLINGFMDADYIINSLSTQNVISPSLTGKNAAPSTFAVRGEMTIMEPKGTNLFNNLQDIYGELGTGASGCCFALKTFFIGHTDGRASENVARIKPIMFSPFDIKATFSHTGGEYFMRFFAMQNGAAKLPTFARKEQLTIKSGTIGDAFAKMEEKLNKRAEEYYRKVRASGFPGRQFEYKFIVDPIYDEYELNNLRAQNVTLDGKQTQITFGKDAVPEQMIETVMKASRNVMAEVQGKTKILEQLERVEATRPRGQGSGTRRKKERIKALEKQIFSGAKSKSEDLGPKYIFKIQSAVRLTNEKCILTFVIDRMVLPHGTKKQVFEGLVNDAFGDHILEFDYIYSGNNIDVLDFDIKMNMGLGFIQSLYPVPNLPNVEEYDLDCLIKKQEQSVSTDGQYSNKPLDKQVLMPPLKSESDTLRNVVGTQESLDYQTLMNRWAGYEMANGKMRIVGNPILFNDLNLTSTEVVTGEPSYLAKQGEWKPIYGNWPATPALMKVNIFTPNSGYGAPGQEGLRPEEREDAYSPFWYRGYYFIKRVDNTFQDGMFTQDLHFAPLPVETELPVEPSEPNPDREACKKKPKSKNRRRQRQRQRQR